MFAGSQHHSDLKRARRYSLEKSYLLQKTLIWLMSEAVVQRCSVKKVFLKFSHTSQENTCARASFLIKLQASGLQLY